MKVVLVDDSAAVCDSFSGLLTSVRGVEWVGCAADSADALALIEAERPEVVVLDVELAYGERGYDLLRRIRCAYPQLEVIILSNFSWSAMRKPFLEAGAAAYFDKAHEFMQARDWVAARAAAAAGRSAAARI